MTDSPDDDSLLPIDPEVAAGAGANFGPGFEFPIDESVEEEPEEDPQQQAKDDLSDRAKEDFVGLMHLGHLEDECIVAGHKFLLRTPSQDDRLDMGSVHKPFLNTMSVEPAWQLVYVSAYLRRIDSIPAPEPLNSSISGLRTRFDWVKATIASPIMIGLLYQECMALGARERACVEYLDGLGERSA